MATRVATPTTAAPMRQPPAADTTMALSAAASPPRPPVEADPSVVAALVAAVMAATAAVPPALRMSPPPPLDPVTTKEPPPPPPPPPSLLLPAPPPVDAGVTNPVVRVIVAAATTEPADVATRGDGSAAAENGGDNPAAAAAAIDTETLIAEPYANGLPPAPPPPTRSPSPSPAATPSVTAGDLATPAVATSVSAALVAATGVPTLVDNATSANIASTDRLAALAAVVDTPPLRASPLPPRSPLGSERGGCGATATHTECACEEAPRPNGTAAGVCYTPVATAAATAAARTEAAVLPSPPPGDPATDDDVAPEVCVAAPCPPVYVCACGGTAVCYRSIEPRVVYVPVGGLGNHSSAAAGAANADSRGAAGAATAAASDGLVVCERVVVAGEVTKVRRVAADARGLTGVAGALSPAADGVVSVGNGRPAAAHDEEGPLVPYDVTVLPPPVVRLGRFLLPAKVDNGHLLRLGDGGAAQSYVVRGVRFRYALQGGRWQMTGKSVEVKTVARRVLEAHLEGVLGKS
ncbi:hypothetical protein MMPV_001958 [Pyropia vietnamensis]